MSEMGGLGTGEGDSSREGFLLKKPNNISREKILKPVYGEKKCPGLRMQVWKIRQSQAEESVEKRMEQRAHLHKEFQRRRAVEMKYTGWRKGGNNPDSKKKEKIY